MGTVEDLLVAGWHFKRAGDHRQAEYVYRQAVQLDVRHPQAWADLGTFCLQHGGPEEAIEHFRRALQLRPGDATVHCNLGIALASLNRLSQAIASFSEAVRLNPAHADARANLGNALRETGRVEEAVTSLRAALELQPNHGPAHLNLGLALMTLKQPDEAMGHFQKAVEFTPFDPMAQNALGLRLADQSRFAEAAACFEKARALRPEFVDATANLGMALGRMNKPAAALAMLREAARLQPRSPAILNAMGAALGQLNDHPAALTPIQEALRLRPDFVPALVNVGNVLRCLGRTDEALAALRRALELQNDEVDAHHDLALVHSDLGRPAEALAEFEESLRLRPDFPVCRKNRALVWLRTGDWARGWSEYEWRWRCGELKERAYAQPRWDGGDIAGKTILLWTEQGLGDTLQFVRFAALVRERGARVLLDCAAPFHPLLKACAGIDELVAEGSPQPPKFDVHCPLLSLPGILGTTVATIPGPSPYLRAEPAVVVRWQRELAPVTGYRIGVCWQGNPKFAADRLRSFPLSQLAPLAELPGVRLVSLQTGPGAAQIAELCGQLEIVDLGDKLTQTPGVFMDAAAAIQNLDLVITCDTAIGHLAGALGRPVWMALPYAGDWRWLQDCTDSPWYPTMRLFRQKEPRNWGSVFADMARELAPRLGVSRRVRPVLAEITPGELVDRITELEVQYESLSNADERRMVELRLRQLRAVQAQALPASFQVAAVTAELRAAHAALAEIETGMRDCEQQGVFGPRFDKLARSAYRENDRRKALKRSIDELVQ